MVADALYRIIMLSIDILVLVTINRPIRFSWPRLIRAYQAGGYGLLVMGGPAVKM